MKKYYFILCLLLSLASSCDNDDKDVPYVMQAPPVGAVFEDSSLSIRFENTKFVSFICLDPDFNESGLARYTFKDGVVTILNPYGKQITQEDVTEPYFVKFEGKFTSSKKMEADYFFVGKHEMYQACGHFLLWRTSPE
ncbi:MAG: hypothetical protein LKI39_09965 [Bacteroides sp.]|jgi:hypothetical protein|nr:hypothetical protein [Bacteroides sp.]